MRCLKPGLRRPWLHGKGINQALGNWIGNRVARKLLHEELDLEAVRLWQDCRRNSRPEKLHALPFQAGQRQKGTDEADPPAVVIKYVHFGAIQVPAFDRGVL
jgi:hypothetical protein